jgi:hypothetical protein
MRHFTTSALALTAAALAMALAVSGASARRIAASEANFLVAWPPSSPIVLEAAGNTIRCPVTIDGSYHSRTISKVCGLLIGYINQAIVGNSACTSGHMTALTETLPWHIRYFRFRGGLPMIEEFDLLIVGARFKDEASGGLECLWGTTNAHPGVGAVNLTSEVEEGLIVASMSALPEFTIPLSGGEFLCSLAGNMHIEGRGNVSGTAVGRPAITVRLVA